jgi:ACS family hexuronate transporter-like MFS transporter
MGFGIVRALLGLSESPNFPAATKSLAEWFPKKERALAMGIINAGTNIGILIAAACVPWITARFGWQRAFISTGAIGFIWLAVWLPLYRKPHEHPKVSAAELAYINSDPPELSARIPWVTLLGYRQTWAFAMGKFLTDAMWWFYMTWMAQFFADRYGLNLAKIGPPLIVVYLLADIGSVGGGWISSFMIHRGASVNAGRKTALLVCALAVIPVVFAAQPSSVWPSVLLLGLATAAHQGWSSNLFTLVSDTFPRHAVASVAGLGGTFGWVGVTLFSTASGYILKGSGDKYVILFAMAGSAYLIAFLVIQALAPRLEPVVIEGPRQE